MEKKLFWFLVVVCLASFTASIVRADSVTYTPTCGDVDCNGKVTVTDALLVLRKSVGLDVELFCTCPVTTTTTSTSTLSSSSTITTTTTTTTTTLPNYRNVRYLNNLTCNGKYYTNSLSANGYTWTAYSARYTSYKKLSRSSLGPTFVLSGSPCPTVRFNGTMPLPKGHNLLLTTDVDGNTLKLLLIDEGLMRSKKESKVIGSIVADK